MTYKGIGEYRAITLTTGVDNLTGTAGNDTFTGGNAEINAADVITGGAGTDTAKLYLDAAANDSLNASGVENFLLQASNGGGAAFTATNVVGAEQFVSNGSTTALTVNDIQNNVVLGLEKTNANLTASFKAGVITGTDTLKINTNASGIATGFVNVRVDDGGAASKFTTLEVAATAGKSYITIDDSVAGGANSTTDFTTIKTSGDGFVSLSTLSTTGAVEPFANVTTVQMNAAAGSVVNLAVSGNAKNVAVTGAAGDDTIVFAVAQFNTSDTVDLGAGKNTLVLGDANLAQAATVDLTKAINAAKGVTTLATSAAADVTINAARYSAIDSFATTAAVTGSNGAAVAINNNGNDGTAAVAVTGVAASGDSLNVQNNLTGGNGSAGDDTAGATGKTSGNGAAGLSVRMATDGGSDTFSLSVTENATTILGGKGVAGANGAANGAAGVGIDAREVETLNITVSKNLTVDAGVANGGTAATADVLVGGNATLNISGTGNVDLGRVQANSNDTAFQNLNIKAGDLVGTLTVVTAAGNDTIIVGSKGSDVTAGAGLDTITLGAGVDTLKFAAGDSGVIAAGVVGKIDVINGFTAGNGGDVIDETGGARAFAAITTANQTTITNQANLTDAITTALGFVATSTWTAFSYDSKTYVVFDGDGNATFDNAADIVVNLVGVTATDLVAANFA